MTDAANDPYLGNLGAVKWNPATEDFDFAADEIPKEIADEIPEMRQARGMEREEFDRLVGADRFGGALAKILNWNAKMQGVPEVKVDAADPTYASAVEVFYTRLMDGPMRHLLPYLSNRDLVDLWICGAFAVPYAMRFAKAVKAKRKAALAQKGDQKPKQEPKPEGGEHVE